jgi:hypothetical protein
MPIIATRIGFLIAGFYDLIIGLAFLVAGAQIFEASGVPAPNHWAYIQFASLLLIIFGIMFFAIAFDPSGQRPLIPFGMLLKLAYAGLVGYYWATSDCPMLFKPFAVIDGVMFFFFLIAYTQRYPARDEFVANA